MNGNPEFVPPTSGRTDVVSGVVIKKVSWGAIFVGAFVSLAILATLALLGFAIGLGSFSPDRYMNPFSGFSAGTGIWWLIISIIAFFIGGLITSRLLAPPYQTQGVLHGIASWAVASLTLVVLAGTAAGMILGGGLGVIGNTVRYGGADGFATNAMWDAHMWNSSYHGMMGTNNPDMGMGGSGMGSNTGMGSSNMGHMNNTGTPSNQSETSGYSSNTRMRNTAAIGANADTATNNQSSNYSGTAGSGYGSNMSSGTNMYGGSGMGYNGTNAANAELRQVATQASHTASVAAGWTFVMLVLSIGASVLGASITSPKNI
jgi:hypothetical protein